MPQAACFLAVSYLDLVLLQQAEFDFRSPPQLVFEWKCMNRSFLTNVNGAGRPSGFPLSKSLIEIALQSPMWKGARSLLSLPTVLPPLKAGGVG